MVVTFTSAYVFSTYRLEGEKFDPSGNVCAIETYAITFVIELRQVGCFSLRVQQFILQTKLEQRYNSNVKFTCTINFKIRVLVIHDKKYINCFHCIRTTVKYCYIYLGSSNYRDIFDFNIFSCT